MITIPKRLKSTIPVSMILEVEDWWNKLSDENKNELQELYENEEKANSNTVSIFLCGKYVEQERTIHNNHEGFWVNYLYDYIVNHELIIDELQHHIGGTCSANQLAEKAVRNGSIHKNFQCPNKDENCLMRALLRKGNGKSLRLYIKFSLD